MVLAEVGCGEVRGLGYSYADPTAAGIIEAHLAGIVQGSRVVDIPRLWWRMVSALRNIGRPGIGMTAVSAMDIALWDLKARLLGLSLSDLLGSVRDEVPVYGSGGFTSLTVQELQQQLRGWVEQGISAVKMKIGREPEADIGRVGAARQAIGPAVTLMVDANGAYDRKQALSIGQALAPAGVSWYEEPVTSDDLEGLRLLRGMALPPLEIAAGEYGYDPIDFVRLLDGAVDVLQADITRCGGVTGFLRVAALCEAHSMPLSSHTAPALHVAVGAAARPIRHLEYFHDHVRIEDMFFDGVVSPERGALRPDRSRPGLGLELREGVASQFEMGVDR